MIARRLRQSLAPALSLLACPKGRDVPSYALLQPLNGPFVVLAMVPDRGERRHG